MWTACLTCHSLQGNSHAASSSSILGSRKCLSAANRSNAARAEPSGSSQAAQGAPQAAGPSAQQQQPPQRQQQQQAAATQPAATTATGSAVPFGGAGPPQSLAESARGLAQILHNGPQDTDARSQRVTSAMMQSAMDFALAASGVARQVLFLSTLHGNT